VYDNSSLTYPAIYIHCSAVTLLQCTKKYAACDNINVASRPQPSARRLTETGFYYHDKNLGHCPFFWYKFPQSPGTVTSSF